MQELLFRDPLGPQVEAAVSGFDAKRYTLGYKNDVPPSLELSYHPTSEYDRHQHLFYMTALEELYGTIDGIAGLAPRTQRDRQHEVDNAQAELSALNHDRAVYEIRRGHDDEAVFFAGRVTKFGQKIKLFETAYELGNTPVILKLGDLRAEAQASDKPIGALSKYLLSEITVGINVGDNLRDLNVLLADKNNGGSISEYDIEKRLLYAGVKAAERQDDTTYDAVRSVIKDASKLAMLRDTFRATQLYTTRQERRLLPEEKALRRQLIKHYKSVALSDRKYERYNTRYNLNTKNLVGLLGYRNFGSIANPHKYAEIRQESLVDRYGSEGRPPEWRLPKANKAKYTQLLQEAKQSHEPSYLRNMMNRAMALALVEQDDSQYELAGKVTGHVEATRQARQGRLEIPFVDTIDESSFRTSYNRRIEKLADAAEGISDLLIKFGVLCEVVDLQLEHDTTQDSTYEKQLKKIQELGSKLVANNVGLYQLEIPKIKERLDALGVKIS